VPNVKTTVKDKESAGPFGGSDIQDLMHSSVTYAGKATDYPTAVAINPGTYNAGEHYRHSCEPHRFPARAGGQEAYEGPVFRQAGLGTTNVIASC